MSAPQQAAKARTAPRSYLRTPNTNNAAVGPQIEGSTMSEDLSMSMFATVAAARERAGVLA